MCLLRHVDVSRQACDKSNAALEGELSTMTVHGPWKEKTNGKNGGTLGVFTPVPAFSST